MEKGSIRPFFTVGVHNAERQLPGLPRVDVDWSEQQDCSQYSAVPCINWGVIGLNLQKSLLED
jgi:hypothetical protein